MGDLTAVRNLIGAEMSYKSPIEIAEKMSNQVEKDIMEVVLNYGIKVDKDELVKALSYDRNQYQQGYDDAKAELERKKGEWISHENYDECSNCHCFTTVGFNYCPHCGAEMMSFEDSYMKLEGIEHV